MKRTAKECIDQLLDEIAGELKCPVAELRTEKANDKILIYGGGSVKHWPLPVAVIRPSGPDFPGTHECLMVSNFDDVCFAGSFRAENAG